MRPTDISDEVPAPEDYAQPLASVTPVGQVVASDEAAMRLALAAAQEAAAAGEVPVGAVVVRAGEVIAVGHNAPIARHDPSAHAEIIALRAAAQACGNYRLADCTLYVTLEPCAMCVGAMLHARLVRVVFGAPDPKTGAAGSVVNLFAQPALNHQTRVHGGVLADECAALLAHFFQARRGKTLAPLRDDALRTPEDAFATVPESPWPARYFTDLPALAGLRLHVTDTDPEGQRTAWLCLHDPWTWSVLYRSLAMQLAAAGIRVIAPDLIGFGRSDKPKKTTFQNAEIHTRILVQLMDALDLESVTLVAQGESRALAQRLADAMPTRVLAIVAFDAVAPHIDAPARCKTRSPVPTDNAASFKRLRLRYGAKAGRHQNADLLAPYPAPAYCAGMRGLARTLAEASESAMAEQGASTASIWRGVSVDVTRVDAAHARVRAHVPCNKQHAAVEEAVSAPFNTPDFLQDSPDVVSRAVRYATQTIT